MESNKREIPTIDHADKLNMSGFLEGSSLLQLRNHFEARTDQFCMGFTVIKHTVTKYWPEKFIEQLKIIDPEKFKDSMEKDELIDKSTLKNYMSKGGTDWTGIGRVVTAMEKTREEILKRG
jgi:hypothetical protein